MEKTMIMLTKSRKMGHYCVAGIDIRTGEWIRVISEDMSIKQAITEEHMRYYDGSSTSVLDVVKVICKARQPNYYQPENWIIDDRYHWKKIRRSTLQEVIRLCKPCKERYIFYNHDRAVASDDLRTQAVNMGSLKLIKPENVIIHIHVLPWNNKRKIAASFSYDGISYRNFTITDPEYEKKYIQLPLGNYRVNGQIYFVISFGDEYELDGKHYKLIATVFLDDSGDVPFLSQ
ncbi:hypothetical protein SCACP_31370 [Sporomusa carbonis]|uniref:dual OB domain-containing protein n=1 Tax=Sporomusa carbonis TaxID=3076075 RepID=UPI003A6D02F0